MRTSAPPAPPSRNAEIAWTFLLVSLFCSLILGSIMVFPRDPFWMGVHLAFLSAVVVVWRLGRRLLRTERFTGAMLFLAVVNFALVVPELALRAVDFRYAPGIRGGYQRMDVGGSITRLIPDEKLFWKVSPADIRVNSLGLPYREVSMPKPPHTYRILFLGDSCTQQGYPRYVEVLLNDRKTDNETRFEAVPLALSGYSSHQGRIMAEEYGPRLDADAVFVYFGWNDHWIAHGAIDAEKKVSEPHTLLERATYRLTEASRLVQGLNRIAVSMRDARADDFLTEVQVPPDRYRDNLRKIQAVFGARGIPVVFITAPTAHYRLGVPDYLLEQRFIVGKQELVALHKQYNQIVRDVARETGAYVLDLDSEISERMDVQAIFMSDGIHFLEQGLALVASRVATFVQQQILPAKPPVTAN